MNCHFRKRNRGKRFLVIVALLSAVAVFLLIYTNRNLDSLVKDVAVPQLQNMITQTVNQAIETVASGYETNFVKLTRDANGKIVSIETDTQLINRFRAEVTDEISRLLDEKTSYYVYISLSNVYDDEIVLGNFPNLKLKANVEPNGGAETSVISSLTSAGINQSLHKIELSVDITVKALLLISTVDVNSKTNVCVAETVIIGDVPSVFLGENIS